MAVFDLHHPWAFSFGILGNIISIFVYFAPLPTFIRIYKEKSTLGFQALPYVVALFSAMLWMYYAFLKIDAMLLISINSIGCVIETIYILVFIIYAPNKVKKDTAKLLSLLNVGLFSLIFFLTYFVFQGPLRVEVVGWVCVGVSVVVFAAPLNIVFQVVRTKSVEFMPFTLSFCLTLSAVMWFGYGLLKKDLCIALPNVMGFFLGMLQMLLYGIYRNQKAVMVEDEKKQEAAEHVINIVALSASSEVHPVDSPKGCSDDDDDEAAAAAEEEEEEEGVTTTTTAAAAAAAAAEQFAEDEECRAMNNVQKIEPPVLVVCAA